MFDSETGLPITIKATELIAASWQHGSVMTDSNADINDHDRRHFMIAYNVLENATGKFSSDMRIGGGGSCEVFRAKVYGVPVAIKALKHVQGQEDVASKEERKQFEAEMSLLQKVRHSNICRLLAVSMDGAKLCLVLPLCHGGALDSRLKKIPPLTWLQRLQVIVAISRALLYLHEMKLVHRDVKTQNVLLSRADNENDDLTTITKLADFG